MFSLQFDRRHSDDPLISGAIDDNQNEFNPITNCEQMELASPVSVTAATPSPASATMSSTRKKVPRTRRKGQFKLRFHHQALPQEYLDHYEAAQKNLPQMHTGSTKTDGIGGAAVPNAKSASSNAIAALKVADGSLAQQEMHTNESVRNWLQKISEYQPDRPKTLSTGNNSTNNDRSAAIANHSSGAATTVDDASKPARVVNYNDLPYMGEMTLENSKPRRGRKPKKADICHLIYKNYGTILPGTPSKTANECTGKVAINNGDSAKADLQNSIINSLLDNRLIDGDIDIGPASSPSNDTIEMGASILTETALKQRKDEPLNLCVRDRSDTMTVSSGDVDNDIESLLDSSRSTPLTISQADFSSDAVLAANLKMALPNFHSAMMDGRPLPSETPSTTSGGGGGDSSTCASNGLMYWPGAGVFLHPMALYYQKMLDGTSTLPAATTATTATTAAAGGALSTSTASMQTYNHAESPSAASTPSPVSQKNGKSTDKILVPKNISQLLKQQKQKSPSTAGGNGRTFSVPKTPSDNSSTSSRSMNNSTTIKRKRSAIFIPPMPNETASNHATEVSICKFKFTGGAKPSLQEKKMLSVDAGGNFRYYSGTGDKSIRGYEFFPRESLQQASLTTSSSAGAFLNTPGKRIPVDQSLPSHGLSNELLQIPELASSGVMGVMPPLATGHQHASAGCPATVAHAHSRLGGHASDRRKRKSRRSVQREKLEKTFKEKGFLIQTQQLESAEGATYCKFRQLRKFTRYLFRSWKDYLPGDIQGQGNQVNPALQQAANAAGVSLADLDPAQLHHTTAMATAASHLASTGQSLDD